jgi:hypothetical protein
MKRITVLVGLALPLLAHAGYAVSNHRKTTSTGGGTTWTVTAALDNNPATAWMVDPEAGNVGQWIEVDTPIAEIDRLLVVPGFDETEERFFDYARIKAAKVEIFENGVGDSKKIAETTVTFKDERGWQTVDLPDTKITGEVLGGKVRLTVTEVYPGKDYPSLAVSEFMVGLKEFPATNTKIKTPPAQSDDGHGPELLLDGKGTTFWSTAGDAVFGVEAPRFGLSSLVITNGPKTHARPKKIEVGIGEQVQSFDLADSADAQRFQLPTLVGYTGSVWGELRIAVKETYPGSSSQSTAIGELKLMATSLDDF